MIHAIFSKEQVALLHIYVRLRLKDKALQSSSKIDLHITLNGVNAVINWFWGHPFHRELLCILSTVHVFVDLSHQPKVWHFDSVITANQNITSCKVTMNEAFLCKMILKTHERIKRAHFIYRNKDYDFLWALCSKLLRVFEITNKRGTQDQSRLHFQTICSCGGRESLLKIIFIPYLLSNYLYEYLPFLWLFAKQTKIAF